LAPQVQEFERGENVASEFATVKQDLKDSEKKAETSGKLNSNLKPHPKKMRNNDVVAG
jgi:hypothetical protein